MPNRDLIDVTYEYMSQHFKKNTNSKTLDFKTIANAVKREANVSDSEFNDKIGSYYVDLLQDNRFVFLGNDQWTLNELISNEVYKKNKNSLYNYNNDEVFEEAYDEDSLPAEMVNADNEVYEENKNEISRDSFSDDSNLDMKYDYDDMDELEKDMDSDKDDDVEEEE